VSPSTTAVVALCAKCRGITGFACGEHNHNDTIQFWIDRGDCISARTIDEAKQHPLCSCDKREQA